MKSVRGPRFALLAVLATAFLVGAQWAGAKTASGEDSTAPGARRALLIGINKYAYVPPLQGSVNDIETMRQILITRYGFPENGIRLVKDTEATRAGIIAAFEGLVKETGPEDVVYIHYSGHGSQVKDLNGDEEDGLDETLIPQDGRGPNVPDIIDDELDEILSRLRARNALIVLDSCHSGTATRSVALRTRSVPPESDSRLALYKQWSVKTRAVVPLLNTRYVLMTGAASHQPALDGPVDGRYHGLFTYALSKSLGSAAPEATPQDVYAGIVRELKRVQAQLGLTSMPEPQLEGPQDRLDSRPVLPAPVAAAAMVAAPQGARQPWVEVKPVKGDRVILLDAVPLGGLTGSIWAIYPPGETSFAGRARALAVVDTAEGKNAAAFIEPADRAVQARSRAILLASPPAPGRVAVALRDVPPDRRAGLEQSLKQRLGDVDVVKPGAFARFVVDLNKDEVKVYGADGLHEVASYRVNDAQWTDKLAVVVSRSVAATELMALDNPASRMRVEARVVTAAAASAAGSAGPARRGLIVVQDLEAARYRIRQAGQPRIAQNSLQLEIRSSANCYLTVVDVDSQGGVNLLFPTEHQRLGFYADGSIRGGETVLLPDSLQSGNQAGFHWDYGPPAGTDTIRVFCSSDLETANLLRQRVKGLRMTASVGTRGAALTRGAGGPTQVRSDGLGELRSALVRRRGLIVVPDQPEQPMAMASEPSSSVPAPQGEPSGQALSAPAPPVGFPPVPGPPAAPAMQPPSAGAASYAGLAAPDWTATSVTVLVEE